MGSAVKRQPLDARVGAWDIRGELRWTAVAVAQTTAALDAVISSEFDAAATIDLLTFPPTHFLPLPFLLQKVSEDFVELIDTFVFKLFDSLFGQGYSAFLNGAVKQRGQDLA